MQGDTGLVRSAGLFRLRTPSEVATWNLLLIVKRVR